MKKTIYPILTLSLLLSFTYIVSADNGDKFANPESEQRLTEEGKPGADLVGSMLEILASEGISELEIWQDETQNIYFYLSETEKSVVIQVSESTSLNEDEKSDMKVSLKKREMN